MKANKKKTENIYDKKAETCDAKRKTQREQINFLNI